MNILLSLLFLLGCSANSLHQNYKLYLLSSKKPILLHNGIELILVEISDSRCPKGVNCITEGSAITTVQIKNGKDSTNIKFDTSNKKPIQIYGVDISLNKIHPYPEKNKQLNLNDYLLSFQIKRTI